MIAIRQALLILVIAALPAAAIGLLLIDTKGGATAVPGEIDLATTQAWPLVLWVDARPAAQFDRGHIPGAVRLTEETWDDDLVRLFDQWNPDARVVVYCDSAACDASRRVALRLRDEVGLERVHYLKGGWEAWEKRAK